MQAFGHVPSTREASTATTGAGSYFSRLYIKYKVTHTVASSSLNRQLICSSTCVSNAGLQSRAGPCSDHHDAILEVEALINLHLFLCNRGTLSVNCLIIVMRSCDFT